MSTNLDVLSVNCPVCPSPAGVNCVDPLSWLVDPRHPIYLDTPHAERREAANFCDRPNANPNQLHAITPEAIAKTGLI